ncbi:hypothetical protein [Nodularia sphaerocarpa]|uniref:hypothetical protein n=1 Tax=Nodularia sphaerocarpa TaxID=137816 RepID=UPI001EFAC783|nr:hypothetical protein [Nodularia sphaerocarpa]MDB9372793.1 hypothetical protein [Nodularia sphaerocarpa CS-585]ULP74155.1 hypothetical protein BDGGKGIB_03818 [Nodularia sphaerocarpa UHCC 0038]
MDIERQKLIEEAAHNFVLNTYGATFGERIYLWENWLDEEDDTSVTVEATVYPPDDDQSYAFTEVVNWDFQTSSIIEEDDEALEYTVEIKLEKTVISGSSDDDDEETEETQYVTLHVFVGWHFGTWAGVDLEEQ